MPGLASNMQGHIDSGTPFVHSTHVCNQDCNVFPLDRTFDCYKDKLSITTVIVIGPNNNLALLKLYVLLGISECML